MKPIVLLLSFMALAFVAAGLTDAAFNDDCQVVDLLSHKRYGRELMTEIWVTHIPEIMNPEW